MVPVKSTIFPLADFKDLAISVSADFQSDFKTCPAEIFAGCFKRSGSYKSKMAACSRADKVPLFKGWSWFASNFMGRPSRVLTNIPHPSEVPLVEEYQTAFPGITSSDGSKYGTIFSTGLLAQAAAVNTAAAPASFSISLRLKVVSLFPLDSKNDCGLDKNSSFCSFLNSAS